MDPLDPRTRVALKKAHPGATDEDVDKSEELIDRLGELDPDVDRQEWLRLTHEIETLLRHVMPKYRLVSKEIGRAARQGVVAQVKPRVIVIRRLR